MKSKLPFICVFIVLLLLSQTVRSQGKTEGLPITVKVITTTSYKDGLVELTGVSNSLNNEPGQVTIEIIKPNGARDNLTTRADKKTGTYSVKYTPKEIGVYKITAYAPDKAVKATATFTTTVEVSLDGNFDKVGNLVKSTITNLEATVTNVVAGVAQSEDVKKTEEKFEKLKQNAKQFEAACDKMKKAVNNLQELTKTYPEIKAIAATELGELSSDINESEVKLQQVQKDLAEMKKSQGGDDCSKFYKVSESCAAFSTVMNFLSLNLATIGKNIFIDKVWPKIAESETAKTFNSSGTFAFTQGGKFGLSALDDLKSIKSVGFGAGMVGDIFQFVSNELFKKYCTEYKGPISGTYTMEFANNGMMNMRYKITYEGKISLFAQKDKLKTDATPKLSGYIEANATAMDFTDNIWAIEDKSQWTELKYQRFAAPVVKMDLTEKDPGFGAAARAGIPGAFYFPLEAQMVDNKMVVKLMPALAEFSNSWVNRTLVVVRSKTGLKNITSYMFGYPGTTAEFILTRTMRMSPTVTLDITTQNGISTIEKTFTRSESPGETKVDFYLKLMMSNAKKD